MGDHRARASGAQRVQPSGLARDAVDRTGRRVAVGRARDDPRDARPRRAARGPRRSTLAHRRRRCLALHPPQHPRAMARGSVAPATGNDLSDGARADIDVARRRRNTGQRGATRSWWASDRHRCSWSSEIPPSSVSLRQRTALPRHLQHCYVFLSPASADLRRLYMACVAACVRARGQ